MIVQVLRKSSENRERGQSSWTARRGEKAGGPKSGKNEANFSLPLVVCSNGLNSNTIKNADAKQSQFRLLSKSQVET